MTESQVIGRSVQGASWRLLPVGEVSNDLNHPRPPETCSFSSRFANGHISFPYPWGNPCNPPAPVATHLQPRTTRRQMLASRNYQKVSDRTLPTGNVKLSKTVDHKQLVKNHYQDSGLVGGLLVPDVRNLGGKQKEFVRLGARTSSGKRKGW